MNLDQRVEAAARLICEADQRCPDPDGLIVVGTKHAKAWEPRAEILRQAIEAGLFAWPPQAWIAPVELSHEKQLEIVGTWAAWTQREVSEITAAMKIDKTDVLMVAQDKGWRQGFQSLSGGELRVVWDAARTAHLNRRDGE